VQIKHSTLSGHIRERQLEQNGLQFSAEDGKRLLVPNVLRQSIPTRVAATGNDRSPNMSITERPNNVDVKDGSYQKGLVEGYIEMKHRDELAGE